MIKFSYPGIQHVPPLIKLLFNILVLTLTSLVAQTVKRPPTMWETWVQFLGQEDPLEKEMTTHSSILAWRIPWTEEPGRLQSTGSLRVGHDWVTSLSLSCIGEGNDNSLQCSCLENPRGGGASWTAIYGVAQNRTGLKELSSSSSSGFNMNSVPSSVYDLGELTTLPMV